jgi:hypothetical protein
VSGEGRFAVEAWGAERRGVTTGVGRDRRTGLPVRVRRFPGAPRGRPDRLDHPNLPGVVALERDGDEGRIVTIEPGEYVSLHERSDGLTASAAVAAADALAALHRAGIVHGDLGPHRVLLGPEGHLLIDGGGVPWRDPDGPSPRFEDDVRALAGALAAAGDELPEPIARLLDRTVRGRGGPRDAAALRDALHDALHDAAEAPPDPTEDAPVVKDLPPGGVYKSGESRPAPEPAAYAAPGGSASRRSARFRPPWRALGLLAGAAALVVAVLLLQDRLAPAPPGADEDALAAGDAFVVDVAVLPVDAPPLRVLVVEAPPASEVAAGTRLGQAPDRIVFDAAGRWVIEGRFGARRSSPVAFELPGPSSVTLRLPSADDGALP